MTLFSLRVVVLPHGEGLALPRYGSPGAAGLDLRAALPAEAPVTLNPGARAAIPTGLIVALPTGCEGQVRARSGWALREGLAVLNAPGTVDEDYRGELLVLLINLGEAPLVIRRGDRVAQLVVAPIVRVTVDPVAALDDTDRAAGGFGSTGR